MPRLTRWVGDAGYKYSGVMNVPEPWDKVLARLRDFVSEKTGADYNSVLVNYYRNQRDSVGWHADDEPELGRFPVICSLSVGETRVFQTKEKKTGLVENYELAHGSMVLMYGDFQRTHLHQIPKEKKEIGARFNYTFRLTGA